jgi:spermidine/putrescine transport system permease protein
MGIAAIKNGWSVRRETWLGWMLVAPALACVALFVVAPILSMGAFSFWSRLPDGTIDRSFTLESWQLLFADGFYWSILLDTALFALNCTIICALVAYGPAYLLTLQPPRRRAFLMILLLLPSWISYIVRTMSWMPVLGRNGLLNAALLKFGLISEPLDLLYNDLSIYIGMVQFLLPLMMLNIYLGLASVDQNVVAAARSLGATRLSAFLAVTFPLSLPALSAGAMLCFILSIGAYVTPMLLGGPGTTYYSKLIYDEIVGQQNWPLGAALALVIVIIFTVLLALYARFVGLKHLLKGRG